MSKIRFNKIIEPLTPILDRAYLYFDGAFKFKKDDGSVVTIADSSIIYTNDVIDAKLIEKSDTTHNHNLNDLTEKSYNSLSDKPSFTSYDNHIASTSNPHSVTASQVGAYTKSESDTLLGGKVSISDVKNDLISEDTDKPLSANQGKILNDTKVAKVTSTDDAIVAFSGTTGEVKNTNLTKTGLDTYIGKYGIDRVSTDLKTIGMNTINWAGGVVPTVTIGMSKVTGLIGAVAGTWNKIGDSTTLLTTAKTTIVGAINELFNTKVTKVTSTDNAIVRFDGTTGEVQNSLVTVDDVGNVELTTADKGVIMKSANGTRYRLTVDDNGNLETEAL